MPLGSRGLHWASEPASFVAAWAKMARWCAQFDYGDLNALIFALRKTNALEESPSQYKLFNLDGSSELKA